MKTSTKLLIAFFIVLPTTLYAFSWLMKQQYLAGHLIPVITGRLSDDFVDKPLPHCKYMVINGQITSGGIAQGNYSTIGPSRDIIIHGDHKGTSIAFVNKYYESLFKTKVVKDTLYVYFCREKQIGNINSNNGTMLNLYLNSDVEYIRGGNTNFTVIGSFNLKHMDIKAMGAGFFNIYNLQADQLNLTVRSGEKVTEGDTNFTMLAGENVTVNGAKNISTLSYSLFGNSTVRFDSCKVATYKPVHIDTAAKMDITIKGNAIQQYLAAKQ